MDHSASHAENEVTEQNIDFGSVLSGARRAKNYTIEEISESLKIPAHTISALESNNLEQLPAPTFAQGYIRAYTKFLEISEDTVLERYNRAVPHEQVSDLKPRSNLPGEASSQSPLIKLITLLLVFAGIAALIFGGFQYYQEKADDIESLLENKPSSFTGNSLDSPGEQPLLIKQNARLDEDSDQLILDKAESDSASVYVSGQEDGETAGYVVVDGEVKYNTVTDTSIEAADAVKNDTLEFYAGKDSWIEVRDANNTRLFYNVLKAGKSAALEGDAPFRITMGNAKSTRVLINGFEADVTTYIRPNSTAVFSVSTEDDNIIFH